MGAQELESLRNSQNHILLTRIAEVVDLKVHFASAQKRVVDAACEREGAKGRLRYLQSSQQRYPAAVSRV